MRATLRNATATVGKNTRRNETRSDALATLVEHADAHMPQIMIMNNIHTWYGTSSAAMLSSSHLSLVHSAL